MREREIWKGVEFCRRVILEGEKVERGRGRKGLLGTAKSGTPVKGETRDTDIVGPGGEGGLYHVLAMCP
jgi:hypothetical protein